MDILRLVQPIGILLMGAIDHPLQKQTGIRDAI